MQEINTLSPGLKLATPGPTASTTPTPSWPRIVPGWQVATSPLRICRSVPQIVVLVILMTASVGILMVGLGRSSRFFWFGPLYTRACMAKFLCNRSDGRQGVEWARRLTIWLSRLVSIRSCTAARWNEDWEAKLHGEKRCAVLRARLCAPHCLPRRWCSRCRRVGSARQRQHEMQRIRIRRSRVHRETVRPSQLPHRFVLSQDVPDQSLRAAA